MEDKKNGICIALHGKICICEISNINLINLDEPEGTFCYECNYEADNPLNKNYIDSLKSCSSRPTWM